MGTSWSSLILESRKKVANYRVGEHEGMRKAWRKLFDVPEGKSLPEELRHDYRILLVGHTGAGKSSLINSISRALSLKHRKSTAVLNLGGEGTDTLEPHELFGLPITAVDSRGCFRYDDLEIQEIRNVVEAKYHDYETIVRKRVNGVSQFDEEIRKREPAPFKKQIHGVIFIFAALDPNLKNGNYEKLYKPLRTFMKRRGMQPVVCLTNLDQLETQPNEEKEKIRSKALVAAGCDRDRMFELTNAVNATVDVAYQTQFTIFNMLYESLVFCERYHLVHESRVKDKTPLEADEDDDEEKREAVPSAAGVVTKIPKPMTVRVINPDQEELGIFIVAADMTFGMLKDTVKTKQKFARQFCLKDENGLDVVEGARIASTYEGLKQLTLVVREDD